MALTKVTYSMIQGAATNVADYGASSSASAATNLAAFKAAVTATPNGGTLVVPASSSYYSIDTSGGLSTAIEINKSMTVIIEGSVKATFSAIQSNPPYIFNVTGDNVTFAGSGRIIGDGQIDDTNTGTDDTIPGLVRVAGDAFTMDGVTIDTPPKVGVMLYDCNYAKVTNCNFTGGITTYTVGNTALFGIRGYQGGNHTISNNQFYPDATGGMVIDGVFFNGTDYCVLDGNVTTKPYEKFCYLYGDYNVVSNNVTVGNTSTIPGTSQAGTMTSVYRVTGSWNKIVNNLSDYCLGGASALDGQGNDISENTFSRCGQGGIAVFNSATPYVLLDYTTIKNNLITAQSITGITIQDGILVGGSTGTNSFIRIDENTVTGFSPTNTTAQIRLTAPSALNNRCTILNNNVSGGTVGIQTTYCTNSTVSGNRINATEWGIIQTNGSYNKYRFNTVEGTSNIGIGSLDSNSFGQGNSYSGKDVVNTVTLAAAATTVVTGIAAASICRVTVTPANASACALVKNKGGVYATVSSPDVTLNVADGTAAAGTEQFIVNVLQ